MSRPRPLLLDAPDLGGDERAALLSAFDAGDLSPSAPVVGAFEAALARRLGVAGCVATGSGTLALQAALAALGVGAGDEVIVPALTYAATANAVIHAGARPVFCDVDPVTWTLDPGRLAELASERTRAVIPVHLLGVPCAMGGILEAAARAGLAVVEDAAESFGATLGGRPAGTLGDAGAFSFNASKTPTTGGGGALVFRDPAALERARRILGQGRRPGPDFIHDAVGVSGKMPALAAAVGLAQLGRFDALLARKRALAAAWRAGLSGLPGIVFQEAPPGASSSDWMCALRLDERVDPAQAEGLLAECGAPPRRSFRPLHESAPYAAFRRGPLPVAEALAGRCLWLPSSPRNDPADVAEACVRIRSRWDRTLRG